MIYANIVFKTFTAMLSHLLPSDPEVLEIPIRECGEPLVDIRIVGRILYGPPPECPETEREYGLLRRLVYEKLVKVQKSISRQYFLRLYEGLRSLQVQSFLFEQQKARIKNIYPELSPEAVHCHAMTLVSPVINLDGSTNVPPHSTGGAVDVEIVDKDGHVIDFGMEIADWSQVVPEMCATDYPNLEDVAKANRRLLVDAMCAQGFVNYTNEWWHFSYGDRYWAKAKGKAVAIYGECTPNMIEQADTNR